MGLLDFVSAYETNQAPACRRRRLALCHTAAWPELLPLLALTLLAATTLSLPAEPITLKSPNGDAVLVFSLTPAGQPRWRVSYRGQPVLAESRLGLQLTNSASLDQGFALANSTLTSHDDTWRPVAAERGEVRNHYNQLVVDLGASQAPPRKLRRTFRAYDEGVAVCYTLPEQEGLKAFTLAGEATEFRFTGDHPCWPVYWAQGIYTNKPLSRVGANCERPLVVELTNGPTVAVGEARLVDYARMRLKNAPGQPFTLLPDLAGPVTGSTPFTTPWRFVMKGDSPRQLVERNFFVLNLNDPCALADTSWIKPGTVIRETTLSTTGGRACVDFPVKAGLQYVEFDAGWYGPEGSDASDARFVNVKTNRPQGGLDLQQVIRYANGRGIGVLLYVNQKALERQLDELLPLYQQWGVKGLKFGFVNVGPQTWTAWLHDAVRKCAQYHLVVDIHDEYRPTCWSRTYPNLLTQEGVRGNEEMPPAEHNFILPFTRFLCGPADCTFCWYDKRIKTTHAHQLAASVAYFSPLQFLFWYDKPAQCRGEPELEFWKHLPTVWDDTRVLHGTIGQYITTARRKGDEWYVGTMNAVQRRQLDIPLLFLTPGRNYTATICRDGQPDGSSPTEVSVQSQTVDVTTILHADLAPNGGQAVRLVPADAR
ncbi:MAG TPA: glycoside hydrolase family 97 N-terminal domain-containing protein [Candidatus Acidoferrum sp.]|nr:glycoside hydrolase family 97 N-terminal domain-containing protein [Candidatus Acidoferrum sp.]